MLRDHLEMALRCAREAETALLALYLPDPHDELSRATTPRPVFLATAMDALHATIDHLSGVVDAETASF